MKYHNWRGSKCHDCGIIRNYFQDSQFNPPVERYSYDTLVLKWKEYIDCQEAMQKQKKKEENMNETYEVSKKDFTLVRFPNGEFKLETDVNLQRRELRIVWKYGDTFKNGKKLLSPSEEVIALMYLDNLVGHFRKSGFPSDYYLETDYIPFRRQDKRKLLGETTFDKWTRVLNNFYKIKEAIPHNQYLNCMVENTELFKKYIEEDTLIILPDSGAGRRFNTPSFEASVIIFDKERNANTGEIKFKPLTKEDKKMITGKRCTIVDDIISYGGTFKHVAEQLKKAGATHVHLIVNHSDGVFVKKELKAAGVDKITIINGGL